MGKCVRIRGGSKPPPPATEAAASCLTLRSGRRVPAAAVCRCSPRTSGRPPPRRHRGWCGAEAAADKQEPAWGGRPRRGSAATDDAGSPARRGRVLGALRRFCDDDGRPVVEEAVPPARAADTGADAVAAVACGVVDDGHGDSFERPKTPPPMTDGCDAAAVKLKVKHENESRYRGGGGVAGQQRSSPLPPPPTQAEIEAFFAAAELAERRRFAEAYNYDVALDRPLEGRFEWAPVRT